jgi:hypothetical protein
MLKISSLVPAALAAAAVSLLAGCVSSHVIVGTVRPAIDPESVRLYLRPPAGSYEEVAILNSTSNHSFTITAQGKTDKVIGRLKKQAASLGANGVLLQGIGDQATGATGVGLGSASSQGNTASAVAFGTSVTVFAKHANGLAIYVPPDAQVTTYH